MRLPPSRSASAKPTAIRDVPFRRLTDCYQAVPTAERREEENADAVSSDEPSLYSTGPAFVIQKRAIFSAWLGELVRAFVNPQKHACSCYTTQKC